MDLWTPVVTMALFFEKRGVENVIDKIKAKLKIISQNKQNADREDNIDFKILEILDKYLEKISKYTKEVYDFINEKMQEEHNAEPLRPIDINSSLKRCGFHQGMRDHKSLLLKRGKIL
jgi:putative protein kinase ArgK-like GTPase of G3E family